MSNLTKNLRRISYSALLFLLAISAMPDYAMHKIMPAASTIPTKAVQLLMKAPLTYGQMYAICYFATFCHEFGHALTAKLLLHGTNVRMDIPLGLLLPMNGSTHYEYNTRDKIDKIIAALTGQPSSFQQPNFRKALHCLGGPLFGLASCYCLLKAHNIAIEYGAMQNSSLAVIIDKGLKKVLLNKDQNICIALTIATMVLANIRQLTKLHVKSSDGSYMLDALNIKNPGEKYPQLFYDLDIFLGISAPIALLTYKLLQKGGFCE